MIFCDRLTMTQRHMPMFARASSAGMIEAWFAMGCKVAVVHPTVKTRTIANTAARIKSTSAQLGSPDALFASDPASALVMSAPPSPLFAFELPGTGNACGLMAGSVGNTGSAGAATTPADADAVELLFALLEEVRPMLVPEGEVADAAAAAVDVKDADCDAEAVVDGCAVAETGGGAVLVSDCDGRRFEVDESVARAGAVNDAAAVEVPTVAAELVRLPGSLSCTALVADGKGRGEGSAPALALVADCEAVLVSAFAFSGADGVVEACAAPAPAPVDDSDVAPSPSACYGAVDDATCGV